MHMLKVWCRGWVILHVRDGIGSKVDLSIYKNFYGLLQRYLVFFLCKVLN